MSKNIEKPIVLISNDDGINASGLLSLIDTLSNFNLEIIVIAPESEQSGKSHSISIDHILRVKQLPPYKNAKMYMCTGTPSDCLKAGLHLLCKDRKPDIVLSGINHGYNFSICTIYSGTIAAAQEGCIAGIPSIAFSLGNFNATAVDFSIATHYIQRIFTTTLNNNLPKGIYLNVNIPQTNEIKGIKVCKLAKGKFIYTFTKHLYPRSKE
ncbi:MAG: 5'/3'-nucleotidase SurE [Solitalea-like symbiont of Acarus siro]